MLQPIDQFGGACLQLTNEVGKILYSMGGVVSAELVNSLGLALQLIRSLHQGDGQTIDSANVAQGRIEPVLDAALAAIEAERRSPQTGIQGAGPGALIPQEATEADLKVLEYWRSKLLLETDQGYLDANGIKSIYQEAKELDSCLLWSSQNSE